MTGKMYKGSSVWKKSLSTEYMFDKMPNLTHIRIPREILDDGRLTANDKLLYGLIATFPRGIALSRFQMCGILDIHPESLGNSIRRLKESGLLTVKARYLGPRQRLPNYLKVIIPPKRFENIKREKYYTKTDISNMENDLHEYFDEIEI